MNWLQALILGIVEGLTEFVPVSSTGHLIVTSRLLGLSGPGVDSFSIVIQLGALLAAVLYYRRLLWQTTTGLVRSEPQAVRLSVALLLGALPTLAIGYLFSKRIKAALFGPRYIAAALIVGGALMIGIDRWSRRRPGGLKELSALQPRHVLVVALTQVAALWPGTSRSMACILGGLLCGMTPGVAADYAFLLAIPTLGAATVYELLKGHKELLASTGGVELAIGLGTSFVVGWLVIAAFLRILRRVGLGAFGVYRIAIGAVLLWLTMTGWLR